MHHKTFIRTICIDANTASVRVYWILCQTTLPTYFDITFELAGIGCLYDSTIIIYQINGNNKISRKFQIRTRTIIRSLPWLMTGKLPECVCACKPTTNWKKRCSGFGRPFLRILLLVVSEKCKRPTVILLTWHPCKSMLKSKVLQLD